MSDSRLIDILALIHNTTFIYYFYIYSPIINYNSTSYIYNNIQKLVIIYRYHSSRRSELASVAYLNSRYLYALFTNILNLSKTLFGGLKSVIINASTIASITIST